MQCAHLGFLATWMGWALWDKALSWDKSVFKISPAPVDPKAPFFPLCPGPSFSNYRKVADVRTLRGHWFSRATVTNYHRLLGLQQEVILLQVWRSGVRRVVLPPTPPGEDPPLPLTASGVPWLMAALFQCTVCLPVTFFSVSSLFCFLKDTYQ